jgi:hypothetical protein
MTLPFLFTHCKFGIMGMFNARHALIGIDSLDEKLLNPVLEVQGGGSNKFNIRQIQRAIENKRIFRAPTTATNPFR